ncbi:hypothetical protein BH10BAC3_BH10BAC3_30680 [soil metagenome]
MPQPISLTTKHNINERKAVKDFLLSRVTTNDLKSRVQLFEERENSSEQAPIDSNVIELRKNKLLEALGEVNKKQTV